MKPITSIILSFLIIATIALIGSSANTKSDWYQEIKPALTPPNIVFPIAWSILYILIAISLAIIFIRTNDKIIFTLFAINLIANALWTPIFFTLQRPMFALIVILTILITTFLLILKLFKANIKSAAYLLIPYLIWVAFATLLNILIIS